MAIARGEHVPGPEEPKLWFSSIESLAQVLSTQNQLLLEVIADAKPASLTELETLTGRKKSNLSRTLTTMANYGLVNLRRVGKTLVPTAPYDRVAVAVDLSAQWRRGGRVAGGREPTHGRIRCGLAS